MATRWEHYLDRWTREGLIDQYTGERIRAYEKGHEKSRIFSWQALLALALGGLLLSAGILLFVAAHWDGLSPSARFVIVLLMVAIFHISGALSAPHIPALSLTLHTIGTVALGAAIFLTGQTFHLQEHWPAGIMVWAIGAWIAWGLLRTWSQATMAAILTPLWLAGEWFEWTVGYSNTYSVLFAGTLATAITYLTVVQSDGNSAVQKSLSWVGGIAIIPVAVAVSSIGNNEYINGLSLPARYIFVGWVVAIFLPLLCALIFRKKQVWINMVALCWVAALTVVCQAPDAYSRGIGIYLLYGLGALGLIGWGLREGRKERINIGVAGFALTVLFFYFSTVMDKLGRSASLVGLGLLFLLGGWLLEKARRRLVTRIGRANG